MGNTRVTELVASLGLQPHPEGGHYREIYRASSPVIRPDGVTRSAVTTIHYLLEGDQFSRWHVVDADEVWYFAEGDGLDLVTWCPERRVSERTVLGPIGADAVGVHVVPAGVWQAACPRGAYCLVGCTVAPGFDFEDFRFVADLPGHEAAFDGAMAAYRRLL